MSLMRQVEVKCPKCGTPGTAMKHGSINVTRDPEDKAKVLDGSIFACHCEKCGITFHLVYTSLYHDMDEKYMILLKPGAEAARKEKVPVMDEYRNCLEGYKLRVVSRIEGLIEKIRIFDSGLDDFAVEMLKMLLQPQLDDPKEITFTGTTDNDLDFFVYYDDPGKNTGIGVPRKHYESCAAAIQDLNIVPSIQYVDADVIADIINSAESPDPEGRQQ